MAPSLRRQELEGEDGRDSGYMRAVRRCYQLTELLRVGVYEEDLLGRRAPCSGDSGHAFEVEWDVLGVGVAELEHSMQELSGKILDDGHVAKDSSRRATRRRAKEWEGEGGRERGAKLARATYIMSK